MLLFACMIVTVVRRLLNQIDLLIRQSLHLFDHVDDAAARRRIVELH
jgi:hypothetical protein